MKITRLTLICLLAWYATPIARAMEPCTSHTTVTISTSNMPHSVLKYIPKQLTLLHLEEPITDDLLDRTNPSWRRIEIIDKTFKKNQILAAVSRFTDEELSYEIRRCIIALAVHAGADPNHKNSGRHTPLHLVLTERDYQLAHYLLKKGANPNLPSKDQQIPKAPLIFCKTTRLAQLLLTHDAQIPRDMLATCCRGDYPPALLKFYLDKKASHEPDVALNTPLHTLATCKQTSELKTEKARILLAAGFKPKAQNIQKLTVMHLLATPRVKSPETLELCQVIITHYLDRHAGFLVFLWYLKNNFNILYRQKYLIKQYFAKPASQMKKLRALLCIENKLGKTAFNLWNIEELNPETCSYLGLRARIKK